MIRLMLAMALFIAFGLPTEAVGGPCYGPKARALAKELLMGVPHLRRQIQLKRNESLLLRDEACAIVAEMQKKPEKRKGGQMEQSIDVDAMTELAHDPAWRHVWNAAEARRLNPYAVFAATIDLAGMLPPTLFYRLPAEGKKVT